LIWNANHTIANLEREREELLQELESISESLLASERKVLDMQLTQAAAFELPRSASISNGDPSDDAMSLVQHRPGSMLNKTIDMTFTTTIDLLSSEGLLMRGRANGATSPPHELTQSLVNGQKKRMLDEDSDARKQERQRAKRGRKRKQLTS